MTNILARYFINNHAPILRIRKWPYNFSCSMLRPDCFAFIIYSFLIEIRKPYPKGYVQTKYGWVSPQQNASSMSEDWHGDKDHD
jgi:hypothetical protein